VIVLVPDLIDRTFLKELVNVLLLRMEFASAFLHQESVCATFSAGLSSACVVNVGGETTHVCCVEEGMSNPNTRFVSFKHQVGSLNKCFGTTTTTTKTKTKTLKYIWAIMTNNREVNQVV